MPRIEVSTDISAPPETVWSIVADPASFLKLAPDAVSVEADPPGLAVVGQKQRAVIKILGRKVEGFTEVVEVEPNRKIVQRQRPGGLFKSFTATTLLEPTKKGTHVAGTLEYEPSMSYLGRILTPILVNRTIRKNLNAFVRNLKELAELKEMPKTG